MNKRCLVCGGEFVSLRHYPGLIRCGGCGFITTDLDLSEDAIRQLYSSDYYNGEEYADYLADKEIIQKNFQNRLKRIRAYVKDTKKKTLFEIGCAYGFFLELAAKEFHHASGIDISEDATAYARENLGLDAAPGDFADGSRDGRYDVICMWDTIEHLEHPDLYLEQANACLRENGIICITTGDIGSMNARIRGRKWRQIHPPTHLHYFSKKTLRRLLEAKGFRVLQVSYPSNMISLNTVLYTILCIRTHHEKLYRFFSRIGLTKFNLHINLYDFMYIIARKEGQEMG